MIIGETNNDPEMRRTYIKRYLGIETFRNENMDRLSKSVTVSFYFRRERSKRNANTAAISTISPLSTLKNVSFFI